MLRPVRLMFGLFFRVFHSRSDLLLENLALRQQLSVLQRHNRRPRVPAPDKPIKSLFGFCENVLDVQKLCGRCGVLRTLVRIRDAAFVRRKLHKRSGP
jgi:hypothetical protein